jgi:peroxiredoxin
MPPVDGNNVPDLSTALELALPDAGGETRRLKDFRGRNVVVYFYPKDDTPGCTVEGKEFRDSFEQFEALDCVIVGVSTDSAERHRAFAEKHALPFILLADEEGKLAAASACSTAGMPIARRSCSTAIFGCGARFTR